MPSLILVNPGGDQDGNYRTAAGEALDLICVSANVTTGGSSSAVEVTCVEQSGRLIAHSRTKAELDAGVAGLVTFAPFLPDTASLPGATSGTVIQTGLAITPLLGGSLVTVHPLDPDAVVTEARLWVESDTDGGIPALLHRFLLPAAADPIT